MSDFTKSTAKVISGAIIGIVVISFILSFNSGGLGNSIGAGKIGRVGNTDIKYDEYENEYRRRLQYLTMQNGGKSPTSEQIEMFGIKYQTLTSIIQRKLLLELSDDISLLAADSSIAQKIKKMDVFQTGGQFDIIKYKNLLEANRLTPSDFEENIKSDIQAKRTSEILNDLTIPTGFAKDIAEIKSKKITVSAIEISPEKLRVNLKVSLNEIQAYLTDEKNLKKVEGLFKARKASLAVQEQVKARHILFKGTDALKKAKKVRINLSKRNFAAMAKKYSEGPSKAKGGDLGWFTKGKMVPEFEKAAFKMKKGTISEPIKSNFGYHLILVEEKKEAKAAIFENFKDILATELIRKNKTHELNTRVEEIKKQLLNSPGQWKKVASQNNLQSAEKQQINKLDKRVGAINLETQSISQIFKKSKGSVEEIKSRGNIILVKIEKEAEMIPLKDKDIELEQQSQQRKIATQFNQKIMESLWDQTSISCLGMELHSQKDIYNCKL